jgi:hypothetical protein
MRGSAPARWRAERETEGQIRISNFGDWDADGLALREPV